jgi:FemAB-related protein (PEP-CTERM system-associated)
MAPTIRQFEQSRETAWDSFVEAAPNGTFFHRAGWHRVIERAFRYRAYYAFTEQDGAITGVLPLVHVNSFLFGSRLISVPFCVYGGPLAVEPESASALIQHSIKLAQRLGANAIEFRARELVTNDWITRSDLYATFRKPITGDAETNLKAIPRKQRAVVRKGLESGLHVSTGADVYRFHRIYAESVRNLGTPVFSRRYIKILFECFGNCSEILTVIDKDEPIASCFSFYFRDEVLPYYAGARGLARRLGAYDLMYWKVMQRAAERGARTFDFGRSKFATGSFAFKKNWGFSPEPLHYQYWLRPGYPLPELNPLNPKYRLMIGAWKRLPLPVANLIGPAIARGIG